MSYRGRLLRPLLVELEQLDTEATHAAGGYDPIWKTPATSYDDAGVRTTGQRYLPAIRVRAQVEAGSTAAQQQSPAGNLPDARLQLVIHMSELETRGLLDDNGLPKLRPNDRFLAIYTLAGDLVERYPEPLYITDVQSAGMGLGGRRNLCVLVIEDRPQGTRTS